MRHGDDQWGDIVRWTLYAMVIAEEFGITSANVDSQGREPAIPTIQRLLGVEGDVASSSG